MTAAAQPLRIAVWHNLASGGGKRALFDHVRGLVERGHHVEAWCPATADETYLPLSDMVEEHVLPLGPRPVKPLRVLTRAGWWSDTPHQLRQMDAHAGAVADAIGTNFDVVFANTCQFFSVPPVGVHARIPSVLYLAEPRRILYEALPQQLWMGGGRQTRKAIGMARAENVAIKAYDRVLVNSRFSRESVLRAHGVAAHVCYLGLDSGLFRPIPNPTRDYVVAVGAFRPEKNVVQALEVLARITPEPPPLHWIGNQIYSNTYVAELEELAARLGVPFVPHYQVPDAELVALVAGARMMLYSPRLEPFGFAPLEANACGVPVVAGAEGGLRESIEHNVNGLLVEANTDALAGAVGELWNDPARAAALGARAREHVIKNWSLAAALDRLECHLYATLAEQHAI